MDVMKLPAEDRPDPPAQSRRRAAPLEPGGEQRKRQKNACLVAALAEEQRSVKMLEELVFGAEEQLLGRLGQVGQVGRLGQEEEPQSEMLVGGPEDEDLGQSEGETQQQPIRKAVWVDEDDELEEEVNMMHRYRRDLVRGGAESAMTKQKLQQRIREQFEKSMGGAPSWADGAVNKIEDEEEDEDDLLRRTGDLVASSDRLPSGALRMKKCLHANAARPSDDGLTTVQFHPSAQVVMTAGLDQSVSLFQVDGKTNPKIQSIHLESFPVHQARFSRDGEMVIATSLKNKMFYLYDMMEGRVTPVHAIRGLNEARVKEFSVCPEGGALLLSGTNGYLHLLTLKTKEVISSMKINGDVGAVAFSRDGGKIFALSDEGEVYVWDMRSRRCVNTFPDDGCVRGTAIAASLSGQHLACGSQSGVVNIYSQEACLNSANPKPLKSVMNLRTSVTSLTFNPSSEILAVASRVEDEAVRLVHVPSLTVFPNFPVTKKKIVYRTSCMDFSPHGGFFSLANNKGHAPLFRLLHFRDF
ncbi:U3 small nucleolar RNA-associated protein 18 homolog isoform X2 [Takifugu rubripes]|uniref:U3 small nucleolar RNA-associated protein 18 homolog isoform X2 n=1 Tax=Takifugu rubripes TaxID=31033 RepID=UPI0011454D87|nr:U3 small nucleolar RNA-associated protein 18 homolog isoform X2 [Takifugu rubripes]